MRITIFSLVSSMLLFAAVSVYADITVSILPFENSAGDDKNRFLNRSITEMIVIDLAGVRGITIVERADIEKILKEQALSLTGAVDEATAPAVGNLLGAQYLVTGSYSVKCRRVSVSYKVIEVESGAVRQAGSVRERLRKFFELKNSLATGIYTSLRTIAGIGTMQPPSAESRLSIDDAVEFGKALDYRDHGDFEKAKNVLQRFTGSDVKFTYAQKTLADVELRLSLYEGEHRRAIEKLADGPLTYDNFIRTATGYLSGADYSKLIVYCRSALKKPPSAPTGSIVSFGEMCDYYLIASFNALGAWDSTIANGERFMKRYPGSMYFGGIQQMLNSAISASEQKQNTVAPSTELIAMIKEAAIISGDDATLLYFKIASEWFTLKQYTTALDWYKKIDLARLPDAIQPDLIAYQVFMCYYNLKSRTEAQNVFDVVKKNYPSSQFIGAMRQLVGMIPE